MGDQDRRKVTPFAKIGKQIENHLPGTFVQIPGWLVGQKERRIAGESARDGNALLFPSGEFPGSMVRAVTQSDLLKTRFGVSQRLCAADSPNAQRHAYVLLCREFRQKVMLLPDVSDFAISKCGKLRFGEPGNILMLVVYRPFSGGVEAADEVQERTFPCSALAYYGNLFTGLDLERKIAKNYQIFIAGTIDLREVFYKNEWLWGQGLV
jgi:hypothetical protein